MEVNKMDKTNDQNKIDPMVAGVTGAIIGAGVAAVTTKVLSDKKMRNKIMETVSDAKDKVVSYAHMVSRDAKTEGKKAVKGR